MSAFNHYVHIGLGTARVRMPTMRHRKGELGYDIVKRSRRELMNRYRACCKKCHLMNMFGSLAVAGLLVAGSASECDSE